jgi:hypothetical protein
VTQDIISDVQKHPQAENEGGCQKKVYMWGISTLWVRWSGVRFLSIVYFSLAQWLTVIWNDHVWMGLTPRTHMGLINELQSWMSPLRFRNKLDAKSDDERRWKIYMRRRYSRRTVTRSLEWEDHQRDI